VPDTGRVADFTSQAQLTISWRFPSCSMSVFPLWDLAEAEAVRILKDITTRQRRHE
jgi:hypothetical protein